MCHCAQVQKKNLALHSPELIRQDTLSVLQQVSVQCQAVSDTPEQRQPDHQSRKRHHQASVQIRRTFHIAGQTSPWRRASLPEICRRSIPAASQAADVGPFARQSSHLFIAAGRHRKLTHMFERLHPLRWARPAACLGPVADVSAARHGAKLNLPSPANMTCIIIFCQSSHYGQPAQPKRTQP